tara:strand:+ start:789 stop:1484 length:696 start_codon:yes stop_codon:yes gene_type:complete
MIISVIVPCYNEINTVEIIVSKVQKSLSKLDYEIIIIDDYSIDGTRELLKNKYNSKSNIKLIYSNQNKGKGFSLRSGFDKAIGDIICIQDADLEYDPKDLLPMIKLIEEDKADVVYGSRFRGNGPVRASFFINRLANFIITLLTNIFSSLSLTDIECCYKVFRKKHIEMIKLEENRFGIEPELTIKFAKLNLRIFEIGISYYGRTKSEGKKIGLIDGFRAIYCIFKYGIFK